MNQDIPLPDHFFDQMPRQLAAALLGKVLRHRITPPGGTPVWLSARIIETEAYYRREKGSHSSQGRTPAREPMFQSPGTIYMYYARGGDSLNFSARGAGNGVLVKSGFPVTDALSPDTALEVMQQLNPAPPSAAGSVRSPDKLCNGQTLLCRSLGLKVRDWSGQQLDPHRFQVDDDGYRPESIVICPRLGIPKGRDEHLPYRFVDHAFARHCTRNPLTTRDRNYRVVKN